MAYPNQQQQQQYSYYYDHHHHHHISPPRYQAGPPTDDVDLYHHRGMMYRPEVVSAPPPPAYAPPDIIIIGPPPPPSPPPPEYARSSSRGGGAPEIAEQPVASKKKKEEMKEKSVSFKPTCTVRIFHCGRGIPDTTADEKSKLYYSRHDLKIFHLEANALCVLSRALPGIANTGSHHLLDRRDSIIISKKSPGGAVVLAKDTPRGLELNMYPTRHRTKIIANKSLLKYQRLLLDKKPNMNSETRLLALANASRKLTAWSRLVAIETARWDASRAYDSDGYDIPIDDVIDRACGEPPRPFRMSALYEEAKKAAAQREQEQERHHVSTRRVTLEDEGRAKRRRKVDENV